MSKTIEKWENEQIDIRGVGEVTYAEYGNNDGNPIEDLGGLFNVFGGGQPGFKRMVNVTDKVRSFLTNDHHLYFQVVQGKGLRLTWQMTSQRHRTLNLFSYQPQPFS